MKKKLKKSPTTVVAKSINYPLMGLVALVVARPLVPEDPGGQAGYGTAFILLWLLLAIGWVSQQWRMRRPLARLDLADWLMLALVGWHSLAAVAAAINSSPRPAVNVLWEWVCMGLLFLLARRIVSRGDSRAVIAAMIGLAVGLSLVAIEQRFLSISRDQRAFEQARESPAELYALTGHWLPPGSPELERFENRLKSQQPSATFALTNSLAGFLVPWSLLLASLLLAGLLLDGPLRSFPSRSRIVMVATCLAVMWLALAFTGSRSAMLATSLGLAAMAAVVARKSLSLRVAAISVAVLLLLGGGGAMIALNAPWGREALSSARRSVAFRVEYWQATLAMIADHPLFGSGPGQFQDNYTRYKLPMASEEIQDPHNWLLEVTATAGIPAGGLLLALLLTIGWRIVRQQAHTPTLGDANGKGLEALAGAACGVALGWLLGFTNGFTLSVEQVALIAVGQVTTWWLLRPWIKHGTLANSTILIAVIALLVNLFASGGIGYPSVADSLWLLAAVGLLTANPPLPGASNEPRRDNRRIWLACLAVIAGLLISAYVTAYQPVTTSRAWLARADAAFLDKQLVDQAAAVERAALADKWSNQAALQVTAARLAAFEQEPDAERLAALQQAVSQILHLSPQSSTAWLRASEIMESVFRKSNDPNHRQSAIDYQRRAIAHYPSNSRYQARLAKLSFESGNQASAVQAAREALRLDELLRRAGHADRELSVADRKGLRRIVSGNRPFDEGKTGPVQ